MDIAQKQKEIRERQEKAVAELNRIRQEFQRKEQELLQEILRLDGAARLARELGSDGDKPQ